MRAIGLRIKSGFAIAAIVKPSPDGFAIEALRKILLSSEDLPQSRFPYHPTIELPERQGAALSHRGSSSHPGCTGTRAILCMSRCS
jgi:hypothetical protein